MTMTFTLSLQVAKAATVDKAIVKTKNKEEDVE